MSGLTDVFTVDEIARAAGVPRAAVDALVASRAIQSLPGTAYFSGDEAVRAGTEARRAARALATANGSGSGLFAASEPTAFATRCRGLPGIASSCVHAG